MEEKHREAVYNAIAEVLIQLEAKRERLNYSNLYAAVNEKIKQRASHGVARRDYNTEVKLSVKEDKLRRTEDQQSKWKNKPVYITLTDVGKRQYHQSLLGIPAEPTKYRRKKLFQLLFFYEAAEYGKKFFKADESFDRFLSSLSLTKNDLKPSKMIGDAEGILYHFKPIKGIKIRRLDENGSPVIYTVTLPGFTLEEILQYHEKNDLDRKSRLAVRVSWTSVQEHEASVYSSQSLGIFSYIQFPKREIESAFKELKKAGLIMPISLVNDAVSSAPSIKDERFIIADERLQNLIDVVWDLYLEKLSMLDIKHRLSELDDTDKSWLVGIFGKENMDLILKEMNVKKAITNTRRKDDGIDTKFAKGEIKKGQIDFDNLIHLAIKKYKPVLQEYDFPLDLVYKLLL